MWFQRYTEFITSFRLNHNLIEIFGSDSKKAFGGLPMIICGDLSNSTN